MLSGLITSAEGKHVPDLLEPGFGVPPPVVSWSYLSMCPHLSGSPHAASDRR